MPIEPGITEKVKENLPTFTKLTLDNKSIKDGDVLELFQIFPKDSHIKEILIKDHSLTQNIYVHFLKFVKTNPNITHFHCSLIQPMSPIGADYIGAIREILKERNALKIEPAGKPKEILPAYKSAIPCKIVDPEIKPQKQRDYTEESKNLRKNLP